SFVIGGEERFDGPTPHRPFDPPRRDWGALQLALQVSWLRVDPATFGGSGGGGTQYADPSKSAREATALAPGVGWILRRSVRFSLIVERTTCEGGAGSSGAVTDRATENLLLARAQVNF